MNLTMLPARAAGQQSEIFMSYSDALQKLQNLGEEHLLNEFQDLDESQQQKLLGEIAEIDETTFYLQQQVVQANQKTKLEEKPIYEAFKDYVYAGTKHQALGRKHIAEGRVGCLLVAGGQGTRLSFSAPKGTYPVSNIKSKSLFQIFAEKVIAAGEQVQKLLPLAIMTSPKNHADTLAFFHEHDNFGLAPEQLFFFTQRELPFLDNQGHMLLQADGSLAKGPDGNGSSLSAFRESGLWDLWHKQGVDSVIYILVDNPLADPFDAELVGFHCQNQCDMTIKCVEKCTAEERVGLIVATNKGPRIAEYSEMPESERYAVMADGSLKHRCANTSLFCFSMDFVKKASLEPLPWHLAYKAIQPGGPMAWKFETFIFDIMALKPSIKALLYPREQVFAPLKNNSGPDSLQTVQAALLQRDKTVLSEICGCPLESIGLIELDQRFYYPTEDLLKDWKSRLGPFVGYIEAKK